MPEIIRYGLLLGLLLTRIGGFGRAVTDSFPPPVILSGKLLYAIRTGEPDTVIERAIQELDPDQLALALKDTDAAKAFWLNLYNAFTQIALYRDPGSYQKRTRFFRIKQFIVAGKRLSLDDIEHGLLRRSAVKWGLGYLHDPFPGKFEKKFRLPRVDFRIHFALHCGAKSCPPIAYYESSRLHQQLELATRNYLRRETSYDSIEGKLQLPAFMSWFRGDFGGRKKIYQLLRAYAVLPAGVKPAIRYKKYNWEMSRATETE